LNPGFV